MKPLCPLALVIAFSFSVGLRVTSLIAQEASTSSVRDVAHAVFVQEGELPIIVSAPHGGTFAMDGVRERNGEGLEKGASGFFTGRDSGTEELAYEVVSAIEARFGKKPYAVVSRLHRKYLDPNRPASIAYESPMIEPIYDRYHKHLREYCREVTNRYQAGVLIDLHGQGSRRDTAFRGTKNGLTVTRLRESFGELALHGPQSLFGFLAKRGWVVHPTSMDEKEQSGFTGGYIVQTYGSHQGMPIDAYQLELGAEYRVERQRTKTAEVLTDALADYAKLYLRCSVPPKSEPQPSTKTTPPNAIRVAVFEDEGVSSTQKLFEVLKLDVQLVPSKISAKEIREGKLDSFDVLIHPGGSGSKQGKALGEEGRAKVRQFIEGGKGMVGICAGAYLASQQYDWSLNVLDAKVIDRQHWNRGFGNVGIAWTSEGQHLLKQDANPTDIYYHQGPLLAPGDNPEIPDYEPLATYVGEIAKNGAPKGVMPGTTAIARGLYGKGRVLCYSPHPEKTPGLGEILLLGIHWVARP